MSESLDFLQPAEWERQKRIWTAWPSHSEYWDGHIDEARFDILRFIKLLGDSSANDGLQVVLWVDSREELAKLESDLNGYSVKIELEPLGDIWFRDIAPIFVRNRGGGHLCSVCFQYNGWGNKFVMKNDDTVSLRIAKRLPHEIYSEDWFFEGGAVDVDGLGTGLTTAQCLLNQNRNPELSQKEIEMHLKRSLGIKHLIWINEGLVNDHTDGHIDNVARFIGPTEVVCMHPSGDDDPNAGTFESIEKTLQNAVDVNGNRLKVHTIPSPGRVISVEGEIMPASFLNFLISNRRVIVPLYGTVYDQSAIAALQQCFPRYEVIGSRANGILYGGGSFHCITQQEPF